jgi:hypothetical protein
VNGAIVIDDQDPHNASAACIRPFIKTECRRPGRGRE